MNGGTKGPPRAKRIRRRFDALPRVIRYAIVGVWNTVFGYLVFVALNYLLSGYFHYLIILTLATVVGVTNGYMCHKIFVFRTQGDIVNEYLRFYVVYAVPIALNYVLLPMLVGGAHLNIYVAQALITLVNFVVSYMGLKQITFRHKPNVVLL